MTDVQEFPGRQSARRGSSALLVPRLSKRNFERARSLARLITVVVVAALVAVLLRTYVVTPFYIPSGSMEPTLHGGPVCNNDHVLVDKLSYRIHDVHRGDVVVFDRPSGWLVPEKVLIKRVVALPGETIRVRNGTIYIDGRRLDEPYVNNKCPKLTSLGGFKRPNATKRGPVPRGMVFVMGDNRCNSLDSRAYGPIPQTSILGRAFVLIYPLGRLHWL